MTVGFRSASIDDVPALSALMARAFDAQYGEGWSGGQLLGTMTLPGTRVDIAIHDGRIGGFTLTRAVMDETELLLIAVEPDQRGRGIGSALIERVFLAAKKNASVRLHLEVRDGNISAQRLYNNFGFACVGSRKAYYQGVGMQRFDALTMSVTI